MKRFARGIAFLVVFTLLIEIIPTNALAKSFNNENTNKESVNATEVSKYSKIIGEIEEKREENTKYFLKEDNTMEAVVYPEPVHYQENGEWKEIDNSLGDGNDDGDDALENTKSNLKFKFGKYSNSKKLVSIKKDKHKISWSLEGANKSKVEKSKIDESELNEEIEQEAGKTVNEDKELSGKSEKEKEEIKDVIKENEKKKTVPKIQSTATYRDVFENTDLEYELQGNDLKENIILKDKTNESEFTFRLNTKNVIAKLEENVVKFYDEDDKSKEVFSLKAPFMIDKEGASSEDIKISLEEDKKGYILTLIPSKEWLDSEDRVYPVTIDPPVTSSQDVNAIQDSFVCSRDDLKNKNLNSAQLLRVGDGHYGETRSFIKVTLPSEITSADMVIDAKLYLALYTNNSNYNQINIYKVLNDWNSRSITWNNQPAYNWKTEDFQNVGGSMPKNFSWDITSIAKDWYTTGNNFGLILRSNGGGGNYQEFLSSNTHPDYKGARPLVGFSFINNTGLESYWTYHSQDVGRAGTGYVNDYNGNLIFTHNDIGMSGNRLPVSITHVYNENERGKNIGFGQGYRLNLSQKVYGTTISGKLYYVYEDEDGTRHYFKADNPSSMKADTLADTELCRNSDSSFTLKDKKNNKINFNSAGALINITDKNNNVETINYTNGKISSVTDGANRVTTLNYNSQGLLSEIVAPDKTSKTTYGYNGSQLTSITYPDGERSSYTFDGDNKLLDVVNLSGYKMSYEYYGASPYRVSKIKEKATNGTEGNEVNISYGYNTTTFTDVRGKADVFQFDDSGKTVSTKDPEGNAKYYKFENATNTTKLTSESKMQKSVMNYVVNSGCEADGDWLGYTTGGSGSYGYATTEKHSGKRSFAITKSDNLMKMYAQQVIGIEKGKTYTFSAYVKTVNISNGNKRGASLSAHYLNNKGIFEDIQSNYINGNNDWTRLSVTFTVPSDAQATSLILRFQMDDEKGMSYFDDFQLEEGSIANRLNLVQNGCLHGYGTIPDGWVNHGCGEYDKIETIADPNHPSYLNSTVMKINGEREKLKRIGIATNVSGIAGDTYDIGAWAKGASVPSGVFALQVAFITGGQPQWETISFNRDIDDWQYINSVIKAKSDYSDIHIYLCYLFNSNAAFFDGVQLYKEEFGNSYTYDDKGNLISVEDNAKKKSKFEYNANNDLVKSVDPKSSEFKYEYDSKHNVTKGTTAENVVYNFKYDSNGNPVSATIGNDKTFIGATANYTQSGNYMSSMTDSFGNKTSYNYDETKGILNSATDANGKITTYNYDAMNREKSVSKQVDGKTVTNSYEYKNDRISKVTHNGFDYNFGYDSLGNNTNVSVGNVPLISNHYEDRTGKLLDFTYGNGQKVTNNYDEYGNIIGKSYNAVTRNNYKFDADGNLGVNEDFVNGITYRYNYDISNRLTKVEESNGNYSLFGFDDNNNKNSLTEKVNGKSYVTNYAFDKDNRITAVNYSRDVANITSYIYDSFGRVTSKNFTMGTAKFNTTYNYEKGNATTGSTDSARIASINNNGSTLSYTYDKNGNIETVTDGTKVIKYYYNELNELVREDNGIINKTIAYSYDAGGNILNKKEYALTSGALGAITATITYGYGDANWKDKLTTFNGQAITYDQIGNPLTYGDKKFTWEMGRQLKGITGTNLNVNYKYNDSGIRTEKTVNGVTTKYHLLGDRVTFESNGTDNIYYTYDSSNNLLSMNLNGAEYYYIRNVQGDIIGLHDKDGKVVVNYVYDSWGKLISTTGSLASTVGVKNPYRYRGYRYDTETGLYYLQSRYYNADWGRFVNADEITGVKGELLSHNMFAYCKSNPIGSSDPSGHFAIGAIFSGLAALGEGIGALVATPVLIGAAVIWTGYVGYKVYKDYSDYAKSRVSTGARVDEKTKRKDNPTVELFRAMDYVEYNKFMKSGKFSNMAADKKWIMDTKWFATNAVDGNKFGKKLNPYGYKVIAVTVPESALPGMYYNPYLDGIGPSYNSTVPYINAVMLGYRSVN
ncbi:DNRLRE domain-containing protein [Clostridium sp. HBUAS56017]|uniref:DNRLRE domain-containing protein n=1 Tax=Clostridium sp. HBUAS56017 TaxID=2571128 RepID=UPI00117852C3|nr:DNRLRE domain-containing protein [Clostridium sp. HBUAS56017]